MNISKISALVSKKTSINFQSCSLSFGATADLAAHENPEVALLNLKSMLQLHVVEGLNGGHDPLKKILVVTR